MKPIMPNTATPVQQAEHLQDCLALLARFQEEHKLSSKATIVIGLHRVMIVDQLFVEGRGKVRLRLKFAFNPKTKHWSGEYESL